MSDQISPAPSLPQMILGAWFTQALHAAAELGVADAVADGPVRLEELAPRVGAIPDALSRLLRALCAIGVFEQDRGGRYILTPLGQPLRSDAPGSLHPLARMAGAEFYRSWGGLLESLRHGRAAFNEAFGISFFAYLEGNPERARIYDAAMAGVHAPEIIPMLDAYSFSSFRTVVDVGGGNGSQLAAILTRYPALKGILFDRPAVIRHARTALSGLRRTGRCHCEAGDFFESVPAGGDAYVLRHVVHDWEDEQAVSILRNCRNAMHPQGKVLLVETVIPQGNGPCFGKWLDLMMLVVGGRERTENQYRELLERAGLELTRTVPTDHEVSVIEAVRAGS